MCSWTSCSISRLWGRGGRLLNRLLKSVSTPKLLPFQSFFFCLNWKGYICRWICLWMSFSFPKSVLSSLLAHFNHPDLISMGWSCHVRILTTVPSYKATKALSWLLFFFNMEFEQKTWNVTSVDCASTHSRMSFTRLKWKMMSLVYEIETMLKCTYSNKFGIFKRMKYR